MSKTRASLKAIFNTANFNGVGATLMSLDVGSALGTLMYFSAVTAGTYNKYHGLTKGEARKGPLLNALTHPAITAATFMGAASYNFYVAANNYMTQSNELALTNLLIMSGWITGFLGDNALRRLDTTNFNRNAKALGSSAKSKLRKAFNAVVSNPTIFYGLTSTFFVQSGLANRKDEAGNPVPMFSGPEGALGIATGGLVGVGIGYAAYRTWQAAHGKIPSDQINDGTMNYMAFFAKLGYGILAFASGEYGLAAAHLMFAGSSLKVIYETRAALSKKKEPCAPMAP